jgi:membrane-associated phospholipid phosphatase
MTRFFHVTMTLVVLITLAISIGGMAASGIRVEPHQLVPKLLLYALLLAGAAFYKYRKADALVAPLLIVFWMGLVSDLHVYPMFLAARSGAPFSDELLARADRWLGIEVTDVMAWMEPYPLVRHALEHIYFTLVFLMAAALLATSLTGRLKAAQEYVIGCVIAVAVSFPLFAVFQAHGPWVHYSYVPALDQTEYMRVFAAVRSEPVFTMDLRYANGLMCFPSFHTILAALAGAALWSIPYVRWVAAAWAGLIVLSTVTTGTHYLIDVIVGLAVAAVSVAGAKGFSRVEAWWLKRPRLDSFLVHLRRMFPGCRKNAPQVNEARAIELQSFNCRPRSGPLPS